MRRPLRRDHDSISQREHDYGVRIAVLEERSRGDARRQKDYRANIEKRLGDLNGEAGRLKTVLDSSVPQVVFNGYVEAQRARDEALERADRAKFESYANAQAAKQEEYQRTQATAFKIYADEVSKWRASINVRLATWIGGATVALAVLELALNRKL